MPGTYPRRIIARLLRQGLLFAAVLLGLFGPALLAARALQKAISAPILDLSELAARVTETHAYDARATPHGRDEVGRLATAMNQMLAAIEERDGALRRANAELAARAAEADAASRDLEERVRQRTAELEITNRRLEEDIAVRRRAERGLRESEERFRLLVEGVEDYSILLLDQGGRVASWNAGAERLMGYRADEVIGRHFYCFYTGEEILRGGHEQALKAAASEGRFEAETWRVRRDSSQFLASVILTALKDDQGSLRGFAEVTRDITAIRRLELGLREANARLEERFQGAQDANRLKSQFLAKISHEVRTPLNAIIGFAQLLHDDQVDTRSTEYRTFIRFILENSRHLLQLINDVLDLAKVEAGKMEFRPERVDAAALARDVVESLGPIAGPKRIAVRTEIAADLGAVVTDPSKLRQILYNYLSNALKFTDAGGEVTLRVAAGGDGEFRVEVEDTGIGIRAEDLPRLFREFQQLETGGRAQDVGTGLGLALTRQIVEGQGGRVEVRSRHGAGSVFGAVLPRVPVAGAATAGGAGGEVAGVAGARPVGGASVVAPQGARVERR